MPLSSPKHLGAAHGRRPPTRTAQRWSAALRWLLPLLLVLVGPACAQGGPPPELRRAVDATVAMLRATDEASAEAFVNERLAPQYRASRDAATWTAKLAEMRRKLGPHAGALNIEGAPKGVRLVFGGPGGAQLQLALGPDTGWLITAMDLVAADAAAGSGAAPDDARQRAVGAHARAIEAVGMHPPADSLRALETGHFRPGLFTSAARQTLLTTLAELRGVIAAAGMIDLRARDGGFVMSFRGPRAADVRFTLEDAPPYRLRSFSVDLQPAVAAGPVTPPLQWDTLADSFALAARAGFGGVVLAQRAGRTLLQQGYGQMDPTRGSGSSPAPTLDTVFDIGSMPIDFTRAAVLGLAQAGRLRLHDPVGRYFPAAPADKAAITLDQLMDGRSGLPNFHHHSSDTDKDLSWIDRDTALQRIFAQPLLFAPGSGQSHSHSAFGLLAAVIEQVTGQRYGDHLRTHLFGPAGMARTGFYGQTLGLPDSAFAVGIGRPASQPNIPPRWGPVSWLVVGSGGMVSSVADMQRAHQYITRHWLKGDWLQRYLSLRVAVGGSDRGFLFLRVASDDGSAVFMASHTQTDRAGTDALVQGLIGLLRVPAGAGRASAPGR